MNDSDFYLSDDEEVVDDPMEANLVAFEEVDPQESQQQDEIFEPTEGESDDEVPLSVLREQIILEKQKPKNTPQNWAREVFDNQESICLDSEWELKDDHEFWTPLDYFSQYFSDEFWEILSMQSNVRAM